MCECLWSDPAPQPGRQMSKRGVGLQFGPDVTKAFLDQNGLELVVRSHEVGGPRRGAARRWGWACALCICNGVWIGAPAPLFLGSAMLLPPCFCSL